MSFRHPGLRTPATRAVAVETDLVHPSPLLHLIYTVQLPFFAAPFCPPLIDALDAFNIALQRVHGVVTAGCNHPTQCHVP